MDSPVRVGLMGLGTVGSGVFEVLEKNAEQIARRAGGPVEISKILVRDVKKTRPSNVDRSLLTTDPDELLEADDIQIICELVGCPGGDTFPARRFIESALRAGKHVVTANKDVLAIHGRELLDLAKERKVGLYYEGAVAGGIPIIKSIKECLVANEIETLMGIINGTTNYMLTKMAQAGASFDEVLREAQAKGYAESDPSSDVGGRDAAYKLTILVRLAFETDIRVEDVYCEGITKVTPEDMAFAREFGYVLKLLAIAKATPAGIEARVHPTLIPQDHPLASVNDVFNAIFVEGDAVGELMFYGRGAGKLPTASAVTADIVQAAQNIRRGVTGWINGVARRREVLSPLEIVSRYYVHLKVVDRPGVLARIAQAYGDNNVSIESVIQKGKEQDPVSLVFITHEVVERNVRAALERISMLPEVRSVANVIRVEGD